MTFSSSRSLIALATVRLERHQIRHGEERGPHFPNAVAALRIMERAGVCLHAVGFTRLGKATEHHPDSVVRNRVRHTFGFTFTFERFSDGLFRVLLSIRKALEGKIGRAHV